MKILTFLHGLLFITPDRPYRPYQKSLDTCAYIGASICIIILIIYSAFSYTLRINLTDYMPPCILHSYTGYYCPGCGGTRSILFFLKGDLANSLLYHPVIVYTMVPGIWLFISHSIFRLQRYVAKNNNREIKRTTLHKVVRPLSVKPAYIYTGIIILIVQCIIKNLLKLIADYSII